jgi:hypothetical protein
VKFGRQAKDCRLTGVINGMHTFPGRSLVALCAVAALASLPLASASEGAGAPASTSLVFVHLPGRAVAGQNLTVAVARAHNGATCSLKVDYGSSTSQPGLAPRTATNGGASWTWQIPSTVQANRAALTAACTGSKKVSGGVLVVGGLIPPNLSVEKDGFSVRVSSSGSSDASFGVMIENHSPNADATNVNVLVNFVLANDHLLGSSSNTIALIPAGTTYAYGGSLSFPGAAPVARLEVVIQVGGTTRHTGHPPALDNVTIEASPYEPDWVGDVAGEVINNDPHQALGSVQYSAVVFDAAGNVLGGGNGSSFGAKLPPNTREVFKLSGGGFRDIPVAKASSVVVSATPTWQPLNAT